MNQEQRIHVINWWNRNGFINTDLLDKVLKAKKLNPTAKQRSLLIKSTINANI